MYHLRLLSEEGRLPPVPIYVDSPMALAALRVYENAFANGSPDVRKELVGRHPLRIDRLEEVHDADASRRVSELRDPSIIIAASGMATGGRVVHHLAAALPDRRNTVILVGFQAEGTRGRRLIEGVGELKMMGRYIRVRAEIVDLPGFSVHADADELTEWLGTTKRSPESVFVVHGEAGASRSLQERVEDTFDWTAVVPNHGERVRLATA
jgi:metallo-beta-lactamase family protein